MSEILRFETNVTQQVALRFDDGKPVEGRLGTSGCTPSRTGASCTCRPPWRLK